MLKKLLVFVLFFPAIALGQDTYKADKPNKELVVNGFTKSKRVQNVDSFFSVEFRWDVKEEPNARFFSRNRENMRFVPGIEFEYLADSAYGSDVALKRYSRFAWLKGYLNFRPSKKTRPYIGGAIGLDYETIKAQNNTLAASVSSFGLTADLIGGVHFYPYRNIILSTQARVWRPSVNFGAGFTF